MERKSVTDDQEFMKWLSIQGIDRNISHIPKGLCVWYYFYYKWNLNIPEKEKDITDYGYLPNQKPVDAYVLIHYYSVEIPKDYFNKYPYSDFIHWIARNTQGYWANTTPWRIYFSNAEDAATLRITL